MSSAKGLAAATWDAVVVGGGHNGLVAAAYLARQGRKVAVVERRAALGGAACSEERVPGFVFSRASYLCSLLRPAVIRELDLHRHGLTLLPRAPSSFTPLQDGRSLLMGTAELNRSEIAKFSKRDAERFPEYEAQLGRFADVLESVLDRVPPDQSGNAGIVEHAGTVLSLAKSVGALGRELPDFAEVLTAPAARVLERWFESEPLRSTLATDAVIGAWASPETPGTGYVLLHHVMGETDGQRGVWAYVQGGMGAVSQAIASAATEAGATLVTGVDVSEIVLDGDGAAAGVRLAGGEVVKAKCVLSNATPRVTFEQLLPEAGRAAMPWDVRARLEATDYTSGTTKINLAVDRLPQFACMPPRTDGEPGPEHRGTIHLGCESLAELHRAFTDAERGAPSTVPLIEMTIPSALDRTISPPGKHVVNLFVQYTPYLPAAGAWDAASRRAFLDRVLGVVDAYAPGFSGSIVGEPDVLTPPDLEAEFGLTGGNIFHGAQSLDRLFSLRPSPGAAGYAVAGVPKLFLCGAGAHPGGGVMGAPGRNAARIAMRTLAT